MRHFTLYILCTLFQHIRFQSTTMEVGKKSSPGRFSLLSLNMYVHTAYYTVHKYTYIFFFCVLFDAATVKQQQQQQERRQQRHQRQQQQPQIHETGVGDFRCPEKKSGRTASSKNEEEEEKKLVFLFLSSTTGSNISASLSARYSFSVHWTKKSIRYTHTHARRHMQTRYHHPYSRNAGIHLIPHII